ncbi:helix-turn-helix domain-containing protein [Phytohabitans flavus]|uniref:helix-turn-helix transcriptional regulator n=1 Tax=Phytohabitans flavus TaxID=1076124 RepID=UPI0031ECE36D
MQPADGAARTLALRLRALRENHWPDLRVTQAQLATALHVSVPLISSWERQHKPITPPAERLASYASFFCTRRSVADRSYQLVSDTELTDVELAAKDALSRELLMLRNAAVAGPIGADSVHFDIVGQGPWHFSDGAPVTIVCAELPARLREAMPHARLDDPDYTELYTLTDLDALFELHGHIRATNPTLHVVYRSAASLTPDDYTTHLVVLGGVDWNETTRNLLRLVDVPVVQSSDDDDPNRGGFKVTDGDRSVLFTPRLEETEAGRILVEDVAHIFRTRNPLNRERTVTICNGMFSRGVLGAVRSLTDERFRDRNAEHLQDRFRNGDTFSILARVQIVSGVVMTPDWTLPDTVLHEWPEGNS